MLASRSPYLTRNLVNICPVHPGNINSQISRPGDRVERLSHQHCRMEPYKRAYDNIN